MSSIKKSIFQMEMDVLQLSSRFKHHLQSEGTVESVEVSYTKKRDDANNDNNTC